MTPRYAEKDNEFIAWYPNNLTGEFASRVWDAKDAAYYVHIPFCTAICDYCGFAIEKLKGSNRHRYLDALRREIARYADAHRLAGRRLVCGHFGGGTPSSIDAAELMEIKRHIDRSFEVAADAEITVEVNPISFTLEKALGYRENGVNRISFGVQSFNDDILRRIGRPHSSTDVTRTLEILTSAGIRNFSLDIIYGVPGQTYEQLEQDLKRAAASNAGHITCFRLEVIPFTVLKMRETAGLLPARLPREVLDQMDSLVNATLGHHGYRRYGAFNFARPGFECVHNRIAFAAPQGEYVGFGNSSYSYINNNVYCNFADLPSYEAAVFEGRDPIALAIPVTPREAMSRFFVLGLKFYKVSRRAFIENFGMEPELIFGDTLSRLVDSGFLDRDDDSYSLTDAAFGYVNNVCKEFYTEANHGVRQHLQFNPTITAKQVDHYAKILEQRLGRDASPPAHEVPAE